MPIIEELITTGRIVDIMIAFIVLEIVAVTAWRRATGAGIPIVVRGPCGGGVSGGPYHSQNVESHFLNTPGLKILAPSRWSFNPRSRHRLEMAVISSSS